jgi:hypothetical protein
MAVGNAKIVINIGHYIGLSTDTKPTCYDGDKFYETDRCRWMVNNGGTWTPEKININTLISDPVTLYDEISSTPASATEIEIGTINSIKIEISGTSTSRTVTFGAKLTSESDAVSIMGCNLSTYALATSTSGVSAELWEFDNLPGLYSLVITPTVISGGNLTVKVVEVE